MGMIQFLDLPREIRDQIHYWLFRDIEVILSCEIPGDCLYRRPPSKLYGRARPDNFLLGITEACKQTREEAMPVFLANAIFNVRYFHRTRMGSFHPKCTQPMPEWFNRHFDWCLTNMQRVRMDELVLAASDFEETHTRIHSRYGHSFVNRTLQEVILNYSLYWQEDRFISDKLIEHHFSKGESALSHP